MSETLTAYCETHKIALPVFEGAQVITPALMLQHPQIGRLAASEGWRECGPNRTLLRAPK